MKSILSSLVILLFVGVCAAQTKQQKPNFSGTWLREEKKDSDIEVTLRISHYDPELNIIRLSKSIDRQNKTTYIYYTDGRGETNPQLNSAMNWYQAKSKTKWNSRTIESHESKMRTAGGKVTIEDILDEWKLSADGTKLTHTRSVTLTPSRPNAFTTSETFRKIG